MNQKLSSIGIVLTALLTFVPSTQTFGNARPLHQERDASAAGADKLFAQWDKPDSPGAMLAVMKDGKIIYKRGYGMADLEHSVSISPATVFNIASVAKQFTAVSILLLARQGKISLDDDVRKYVPEMPKYDGPITVRQLVHHTGGLRDYGVLMSLAGVRNEDYYDDDDVMDVLARQKKLNFKPGSEHLYSNSGYFLVSVIVQRASGKSLSDFAEENIFRPLGMKDTHFHDAHAMIIPNRAVGYSPKGTGVYQINMPDLDVVGAGNLYTTIEDLFLWDQNFYNNKLHVAAGDLISQVLTPGTLNRGEATNYAFGLYINNYRGLKLVSHAGDFAGYRAEMLRFPEQRFSVICLANVSNLNAAKLARQVADIYLADQLKPDDAKKSLSPILPSQFIKLSEQELAANTGSYRDPLTNDFWRVSSAEGNLVAATTRGNFKFAPLSRTHFRSTNLNPVRELVFETTANSLRHMHVNTDGRQPATFEAVTPALPTAAQLAEYVGDYYNDELQVIYKVVTENDKPFVRLGYGRVGNNFRSKNPLTPTIKDEFNGNSISVKFVRDKENRITAFMLSSGRVKDLYFLKR
jgi:CubicO group peptidase (beta-lactamase class C family)